MARAKTVAGLVCALWLAVANAALAQPSCGDWNTPAFFQRATAADVSRCLAGGADLEARGENGVTPLHHAAAFSKAPAVVTALLAAGADLEARAANGVTPLHVAAVRSKTPAVVTALLAAGADLEARGKDGQTPLHVAVQNNTDPRVVKALLGSGLITRR